MAMDQAPFVDANNNGCYDPHNGDYPIIGVNTFLSKEGSPTILPKEVIRATKEEKLQQIDTVVNIKKSNTEASAKHLQELKKACISNENIFAELMQAVKTNTLGQITQALYEVGGQYRRNM